MNHWWVNHKQTAKQEINGGYVWSPKRKRGGQRSRFYDFMKEMRPGDHVVSFANATIGYIGIVIGFPSTAPKPLEFGNKGENWSHDGWLVPIEWKPIRAPFRPKDNIDEIRDDLPDTYSPIQTNGNGNQAAYLTKIGVDLFKTLERLGGFEAAEPNPSSLYSDDQTLVDAVEDHIADTLSQDQSLDATEKDAVIKSRKGQGRFRRNVEKLESACRVTALTDKRLLIASHIKPWRVCETAKERLDGANGLLLAPHVDRLFDAGLISFEDDGTVLVSDVLEKQSIQRLGLESAFRRTAGDFSAAQRAYLSYHRESVFLG